MPDEPQPPKDDAQPPKDDAQPPKDDVRGDHRHRWDMFGVVVASLIGLLALVVSGYTAYIERQQVRAQVWPYLVITTTDLLPSSYVAGRQEGMVLGKGGRFLVVNKGVGPAILERVEIEVNGRPQANWGDVMRALGIPQSGKIHFKFSGTVISPGETVNVLAVADQEEWQQIKARLYRSGDKVIIRACYRSTLGDYWLAWTRFHENRPGMRAVHDCRDIPEATQFES